MSKTIDEKVVEMQFDNKDFEKNVKASIESLDELKRSLELEQSAKSLDNLTKSAKNFNLDGVNKAVDEVGVRFNAMQVIATTALANLTNTAVNYGKKLVGGFFGQIKSGGMKRALNIENARFQIEGLKADWDALYVSMDEAVTGTAYGIDSAAKAAAQLTASGVKAGNQMTKALRGISGVAAMTNREYDDVAHIFTTIAGQGRVMGMQLTQLSSYGLNVAATLGEQLGKSEAEIRDLVSKGKIDFKTFANAMDDAFGEHAKDANNTFTGALSNMKAALSRIGEVFATPLLENARLVFLKLKLIFDKIKNAIKPWSETISSAMEKIYRAISYTIGAIKDKIPEVLPVPRIIQSIADSWDEVLKRQTLLKHENMEWLADSMVSTHHVLKDIFNSLWDLLAPLEQAFLNVFGPNRSIQHGLANITAALEKFSASMKITSENAENMQHVYEAFFSVASIFVDLFNEIFHIAQGYGDEIVDLKDAFFNTIGNMALRITDFVKRFKKTGIIQRFGKTISHIAETISYLVKQIVDFVKENDILTKVLDQIIKPLSDIVIQIIEIVSKTGLLEPILKLILTIVGGLASGIGFLVTKIKETGVIQKIVEKLTPVIETIIEQFEKAYDLVVAFFERCTELDGGFTWENVTKVLEDFWKNVILGIAGNLGIELDKVIQKVKTFFLELSSQLEGPWKSITDGISKAIEWVSNAFKKITGFVSKNAGGLISSAGIVGMIVALIEVVKFLLNLIDTALYLAKGIKGVLDTLQGVLKDVGKSAKRALNALAITEIAAAVLMIAAAIAIISQVTDTKQMINDIIIIFSTFIILTIYMGIVSKMVKGISKGELVGVFGILIAFSLSLLILAFTLQKLDSVGDVFGEAGDVFNNLLVLCGIMLGCMYVLSKINKLEGSLAGAALLLSFSISLLIVVQAIKQLTDIGNPFVMEKAIMGIVEVIIAMSVAVAALALMGKTSIGSALAIIAFAGALYLVVLTIKKVCDISDADYSKGMDRLKEIVLKLGLVFLAARVGAKGAKAAAASIIAMGLAIALLAFAIKIMEGIEPAALVRGILACSFLMIFIGIFGNLTTKITTSVVSKNGIISQKASSPFASIIAMALAMVVLAGAIALLSLVDQNKMVVAAGVLGGLIGVLSLAMLASSNVSQNHKSFIGLAVVIGVLAIALLALSLIPNPEALTTASIALAVVISVFALLIIASGLAENVKIGPLFAVLGVFVILVGSLLALNNLAKSGIEEQALALVEVVVAISLLLIVLTEVSKLLGPTGNITSGLLAFVETLGVLMGVFALIALLASVLNDEEFESLSKGMDRAIEFAGKFSEFFGSLVSGFLVGIADNLSKSMDKISVSLSMFITRISMAFNILNLVPDAAFDKVGSLASAILELSKASKKNIKFKRLNEEIPQIIDIIKSMSDGMKDVTAFNLEKVATAAEAISLIAAAAKDIPNQGGLLGKIFGENNIGDFVSQLADLGPTLTKLSTYGGIVDKEKIQTITDAFGYITDAASKIPNEGGLWAKIFGDNKIDTFVSELTELGPTMQKLSEDSVGIDKTSIQNMMDAFTLIVTAANEIPNEGGAWAAVFGDNQIDVFGVHLLSFGYSMSKAAPVFKGIDATSFDAVIPIMERLFGMTIPKTSNGFFDFFSGREDLKDLSEQLPVFGSAIRDFINKFTGVDDLDLMPKIATGVIQLSSMFASMTGNDGASSAAANFKSALNTLGNASIEKFIEAFSDSNKAVRGVMTFFESVSLALHDNENLILDAVGTVATDAVDKFTSPEIIGKFDSAGEAMITAVRKGLWDGQTLLGIYSGIAASNAASKIRDKYDNFYKAGKYLVEGFAKGINDYRYLGENAATDLGTWAYKALTKALDERSPSKLSEGAGNFFTLGFVNGIVDLGEKARTAASNVGKSAYEGLSTAISNIRSYISEGIDADPVIRPVLDLSAVRSGASTINTLFGNRQALAIAGSQADRFGSNDILIGTGSGGITFNQNNYSPKALSQTDIYRQTKNLLSLQKGMANA